MEKSLSIENLFILVTLIVLFQATKQLTVSNVKTMRMNDDVLVVAISPDAKYIAVALLDSTVKVRFVNPILFSLCLYKYIHIPVKYFVTISSTFYELFIFWWLLFKYFVTLFQVFLMSYLFFRFTL
jgi:hypothetical protein